MVSLHARPDFSYVFKKRYEVKVTHHKYIYAKQSQWSWKQATPEWCSIEVKFWNSSTVKILCLKKLINQAASYMIWIKKAIFNFSWHGVLRTRARFTSYNKLFSRAFPPSVPLEGSSLQLFRCATESTKIR